MFSTSSDLREDGEGAALVGVARRTLDEQCRPPLDERGQREEACPDEYPWAPENRLRTQRRWQWKTQPFSLDDDVVLVQEYNFICQPIAECSPTTFAAAQHG
ncbi:hypothetical protein MTO96_016920 [Rhipicephalus appendiculatus]